jgi:uncharacterized delta-60 repeat protein
VTRPWFGAALAAAALVLTACGGGEEPKETSSPAQQGADVLDSSFGQAGLAKIALSADANDQVTAVTVGSDGKIYAAGFVEAADEDRQFAVARANAGGSLDPTFGTDGVAIVNVAVGGGSAERARGVAVQADGKVVLSGTAERDPTAAEPANADTDAIVVRFTAAGKPDASFGTNGIARLDIATGHEVGTGEDAEFLGDTGYGLTLLPDGSAVVLGSSAAPGRDDHDLALIGVTTAGKLNPAFGTNGVATFDGNGAKGDDSPRQLLVVGDQIVATGYTHGADAVVSPVLVRTSLAGEPDTSFGKNGVANHVVLGHTAESYQVGVQGDNYVMVGYGRANEDDELDMVSYRFTKTGEWDKTYGEDGVAQIDNAKLEDRGRNLAVLPDDRIVLVGGGSKAEDALQPMVVLLDKDGQRVSSFGDNGVALTDVGGTSSQWFGLKLSADGKSAIVAGYSSDGDGPGNDDSYLAKVTLP